MEKLVSLRGALKELYAIRYTDIMSILIVEFEKLNLKYFSKENDFSKDACDIYI